MKSIASVLLAMLLALFSFGACSAESAGAPPVRAAVNDYSWSELSAISERIAAEATEDGALAVAKRYHLANDDGTLDGSQFKEIELATGEKARVLVAGFAHDERAGGGKAGITFVFADAVALRGMNGNTGFRRLSESTNVDAYGGWDASDLRRWLNGEFASLLPADMQAALADVVKSSLVVPSSETETDDAGALLTSVDSLVGKGVDRLWVPALVELSGVKGNSETAQAYPEWTAPLRAEGSQYRLFADAGASERKPNEALVRSLASSGESCRWWLRSLEDWTFAQVLEDGAIDRRDRAKVAATAQGVVPCFAV